MELQSFMVQLVDKNGGNVAGRVRLQKIIYFCKALGADIDPNYKLYVYGPFSQQVADTLQDCVMEDILVEKNGFIQEGIEFEDCLKSATSMEDLSMKILIDVLELCEALSTRQLEIDATTFFINRQQKILFGCEDKQNVIDKVIRAKGKRFTEEEITESYQRVVQNCFPLVEKYAVARQ
ncbi:hypothetical protein V1224_00210 [Lachnospiraceae bacterium JLR.KK008]